MPKKTAIIIGAGPAGLTAAYELLDKTDIKPIILEMSNELGGMSKTINYKGNRIDLGGHRFFSKSGRIIQWWQNILPLQGVPSKDDIMLERKIPLAKKCVQRKIRNKTAKEAVAPNPEKTDKVMLFRGRLSRIFFLRKFFDYPVSLNFTTLANLGITRLFKIFFSYVKIRFFPIKNEENLEDFFINRFGRELYQTFFKNYTEKVWGVPCNKISPQWGAQRIKGLSVTKAIFHAVRNILDKDSSIAQKKTETSLIEQFMYPKFGPGQMWEEVNRIINANGGQTYLKQTVISLKAENNRIIEVHTENSETGAVTSFKGDYFFSTMPVKDLIKGLGTSAPDNVREIADGLVYRDFITTGLLLKKLKIKNKTKIKTINNIIPDNWIYIQEPDVKLCRLQIFNNWSPYLVKDQDTAWIGLEYICTEGDGLWQKQDKDFSKMAIDELAKINIIDKDDVLDSAVIRYTKAYPAYFGTYDRFWEIIKFTDGIENLFLIGRNGMHRYNNQDHSMLTAMVAVENVIQNKRSKENIWKVNAEEEYHEQK